MMDENSTRLGVLKVRNKSGQTQDLYNREDELAMNGTGPEGP